MEKILTQLGGLLLNAVPTVVLLITLMVLYKLILHNKLVEVLGERRARTEEEPRADPAGHRQDERRDVRVERQDRLPRVEEERQRLATVVRSVPFGVAIANADGTDIRLNPAGAIIMCHEDASNPARPVSATVGTSGSTGKRCGVDTASARSLPSLIKVTTVAGSEKIMSMRPPMMSLIASAGPL